MLSREIVSFVRAYARSGCLVELDLKSGRASLSLFPFWPGELSLFPFGPGELSLFPSPPTPQTSYPTLVLGTQNVQGRRHFGLSNLQIFHWVLTSL